MKVQLTAIMFFIVSISFSQNIVITPQYIGTPSSVGEADYFASSYGNDGNNGTSNITPKRTLVALTTLANSSTMAVPRLALEGGSIFRGGEGITLTRGNVNITSYNRGKAGKFHFPQLIGTDAFITGWALSGSNTYSQNIANTFTDAMNGYSFMYVVEIDTLMEKVAPLTARRYLHRAVSLAAVDTVAGSYFAAPTVATTPISMAIHTTDGVSPNNNPKFRYEVVTRNNAIYRNLGGTFGQEVRVENVFAMDFAQGSGNYGTRQDSLYVNHCISMGNATHQGGGGNFSAYNNCAFITGDPTIMQYAVVFYQINGAHETDMVQNSFFLDQPQAVYTHTSYGATDPASIPHGKFEFKNNYVFNSTNTVIQCDGTLDTFDINYSYIKNSQNLIKYSFAGVTYLRNSVMDNGVLIFQYSNNTVINNFLYRSKSDFSTACIYDVGNKLNATNSIFHFKTKTSSFGYGGRVFGNGDTSTRTIAKYNIFVCEVPTGSVCEFMTANNWGGTGTNRNTVDYNAYVIVSGTPTWVFANTTNSGGLANTNTFSVWKTQSGSDAHSVLIDLRYREADLRRIFVDPDAGNYNFTSSPQADSIRAIIDGVNKAGMITPLGSWVNTPSREEVVDIIENDKFKPVSSLFFEPVTGSEANKVWNGTTYTKLW